VGDVTRRDRAWQVRRMGAASGHVGTSLADLQKTKTWP
jgi:hypothetical protein